MAIRKRFGRYPLPLLKSGVYLIKNLLNGKVYVGSSVDLQQRWRSHRGELREGTHWNKHLQSAWNKYGEESFAFIVVVRCSPWLCMDWEQLYIDELNAVDSRYGYNINRMSNSSLGFKHSEEQRAKRGELMRRRYEDPEERKRTGEHSKAAWADEESRERRLASLRESAKRPDLVERRSEVLNDPATREKQATAMGRLDVRLKNSDAQTEVWAREGYHENMVEIHRKRCEDPVGIEQASKAGKAAFETQEQRDAKAEDMKRLWKDPAYREMMLTKRRESRERKRQEVMATLREMMLHPGGASYAGAMPR